MELNSIGTRIEVEVDDEEKHGNLGHTGGSDDQVISLCTN